MFDNVPRAPLLTIELTSSPWMKTKRGRRSSDNSRPFDLGIDHAHIRVDDACLDKKMQPVRHSHLHVDMMNIGGNRDNDVAAGSRQSLFQCHQMWGYYIALTPPLAGPGVGQIENIAIAERLETADTPFSHGAKTDDKENSFHGIPMHLPVIASEFRRSPIILTIPTVLARALRDARYQSNTPADDKRPLVDRR